MTMPAAGTNVVCNDYARSWHQHSPPMATPAAGKEINTVQPRYDHAQCWDRQLEVRIRSYVKGDP